jgi:hypothetical protein
MNSVERASLFGSFSVNPYPLLAADNRPVGHDLLIYGILQSNEETATCEFFAQHLPILCMGLCESLMLNVALNIMFIAIDLMFSKPQSALLKDHVIFVFGVNLLSRHCYGHFLAKQGLTTANYLATTPAALRAAVLQFTVFPSLITVATAIMIFCYLESIGPRSTSATSRCISSTSRWS